MKKFLVTTLFVFFVTISFGCKGSEICKSQAKIINSKEDEFKEFLVVVINKDCVFREHYDEVVECVGHIIDILKEDKPLESEPQSEAIQIIKNTQRKLEELRASVIAFENSSSLNIRKVVKEFLKIYEHGSIVLEQDYNFILSPEIFLSTDEGVKKLNSHKALLKQQYEHIVELLKGITEKETVKSKEVIEKIEFQYSPEELKAMDKWKNRTMDVLISDALNGDSAALHMLGLGYLYGQGGFPINVESADMYFATSALLGFAPAIDKIKGKYLDDTGNPNPFLFFVYLNLTASLGHPEFTMLYHDQRKIIVERFGDSMAKEIERVASNKLMKIYKAMNQLAECGDKMKTTSNFLFVEHGIIGEDTGYDSEYWEKFFNKKMNNNE